MDEDSRLENAAKLVDLLTQMRPPPPALERLPCAYTEPAKQWSCPNAGMMLCAGCRLVAYCSKECQKCHWLTHKTDCKDQLRSKAWTPGWVLEGRQPTFMSASEGLEKHASTYFDSLKEKEPLSMGLHIWGNTPAMDLLNLASNEGLSSVKIADLDLALPASGDLRHVIMTINALPEDYSGTISFVLNDREPIIVARNIALLLLFTGKTQIDSGSPVDASLAAEIALHFWASVYLPSESDFRLVFTLSNFLTAVLDAQPSEGNKVTDEEISVDVALSEKSRLKGSLPAVVLSCLHEWGKREQHDIHTISEEMRRVRRAPGREDRHHRHYCRLEPSHRVSFEEFRRFGLTLPFGARNDLFSTPNRLLFSPSGRWLQSDIAKPLESWDIEAVVAAGKKHGASREDLYGCLYFFLSDVFRKFVDRLRRFSINFEVYCTEGSELTSRMLGVRSNPVDASRRFDRVHVSNLVDENYCGITGVLTDWGPLLKTNRDSCILAYFMNWPVTQKGANWQSVSPEKCRELMKRYSDEGKVPKIGSDVRSKDRDRIAGIIMGYFSSLTAAIDNSGAFENYLGRCDLNEGLKKTGMRRRLPHSVLPYRLGVPPGDSNSPKSLPTFLRDNDRWYLNTCVGEWLWSERFIEFCRDE